MWKPKEVLKTKILENYETFFRIIIAILFIMIPLQLNLSSIENGLNKSWVYAENRETDIYFVCGDVIYNTGKKSRHDVLNLFGVSGISADNIGYTCLLPETDTLSVLLVDKKEHVILEKQIW